MAEKGAEREQKRQAELQRQRDEEVERFRLAKQRGGGSAAAASVSFLYALPPGLLELQQREREAAEAKKEALADAAATGVDATEDETLARIKRAPKAGEYANELDITPQPFVTPLRKVRCVRCKKHGHKSGDRECPLKDDNPNGTHQRASRHNVAGAN